MKDTYLIFKYGKKQFVSLDVVSLLADYFKTSKSEVRRTIDQGGVDVWVRTSKEE